MITYPSYIKYGVLSKVSILICVFMLSHVYAQSAKDIARQSFKEGSQAYKKGKYPRALKAFEYAYQKYPLPMMLFNIASTYEAMKQLPQALKYYQMLVETGKDDGDARKKIKQIKKKLARWAKVDISSTPSNAEVFVNHTHYASWGKTPKTFLFPPNEELTLYLKAKGYQTLAYAVRFKKNEKKTLNLQLKGKSAFVRIMGTPKNLTAQIKDKTLKGLPIIYDLGVGQHEVKLFADGYLPEKRTITLSAIHTKQAPLSLEVSLKSSQGLALLVVQVKQNNAMLLVDGTPKGQSPFNEPIELKAGEHLIELRDQQGKTFTKKLVMTSGETENLKVDLLQSSFFTKKRVSFTLLSLGGASLIAGLAGSILALSTSQELDECRAQFACARKQGELNLAQDVRGYSLGADVFLGIGLALGISGGVLYWLDNTHQKNKASRPQVQLVPTDGGAAAFTSFTF